MDDKILIDTDILIDFLRGEKNAKHLVERLKDKTLLTTDINAFELYHGAYKQRDKEKSMKDVENLLNLLQSISTDRASMKKAAEISADLDKRGQKVDTADILIGSMCVINSASILTGNKRHFERMNVKIFNKDL